MKKVFLLLVLIAVGFTAMSMTKVEAPMSGQKMICSSGTGTGTYGVALIDGVYWSIPSLDQQNEGAYAQEISGAMASLMCTMME